MYMATIELTTKELEVIKYLAILEADKPKEYSVFEAAKDDKKWVVWENRLQSIIQKIDQYEADLKYPPAGEKR